MWQRNEELEWITHTFKKQQDETAKEIAELRKELKEQKEININLEAYRRRESISFRNIREDENKVSGDIIQKLYKTK